MLIDKVRVNFVSGAGGSGAVSFHKSGKPDGGDGGHGGDVFLEGDSNIHDLRAFNAKKQFEAGDANRGALNRRTGANGEDLIVKVPLITRVFDLEGNFVTAIKNHGQRELLLKGGAGGKGNYYFRKGQVQTLKKFTPGKPGKKLLGFLELELKAEVIFIGLPNAGKSSMLNVLTNSKSKVAAYPFTTLEPFLGVMDNIKLMDLPGLIEGTSKGKGLGSNFAKHAKNSLVVAHFLSLDSEDLQKDYNLIVNELKDINPDLLDKPEILVLTKSDNYSKEEITEKIKIVKKFHKNYLVVSIIDDDSVDKLRDLFLTAYENLH
jgi:GTP-binding protein